MKKLIIMFALLLGVVSMKAQSNDLYQGITKEAPLPPNGDTLRRTGDVCKNSTPYFPVCR